MHSEGMGDEMSEPGKQDVCVVGGGLIGLSVGYALSRHRPGLSILVLEKEDGLAMHQSGHNSGVIHSGLYYRPGSLKAQLSVEGREALYRYCQEKGIANQRSGKLVIATDRSEIPALEELERRGNSNGLNGLRRLGPRGIAEVEPEATGVEALHVPEAGVVDFPDVASSLASHLITAGCRILTGHAVTAIRHTGGGVEVVAGEASFRCGMLINCAGLQSDRVARLAGVVPEVRIVPFRGEYYRLSEESAPLVRTLIYPVPDPRFPFLGVHFTRRIDGTVEVGPNAVLALGREHYRGAKPNWGDVREVFSDRGFRRLALKHWRAGGSELLHSRSRRLYARLARRLVPAVTGDDLLPGGAGVRAQAVARDGSLVDDFVIERVGATVHVLNAPSPGATASLAIGEYIAKAALS